MTVNPHYSKHRAGFTLTEVVAASFVLLICITIALSGYIYALKNSNQLDEQTELDFDVQLALEYLKEDLRLSAMDRIYYHPAGAPPYEAISFPKAYTNDTGMLPRGSDERIIWQDTIIYHIKEGTPDKLVRTVIPRSTNENWQAQLESVVDGSIPTNAQSKIIFENLLSWELNPRQGTYNGYAEELTVDKNAFLGFALIDSGTHTFTFEASAPGTGGGYQIGIDTLRVTPSYLAREIENVPSENMQGASLSTIESTSIDCSGGYYVNFPATQVGNQFTVKVDNDRWEETNFTQGSRVRTVTDRNMTTPSDAGIRLSGFNEAWDAETQTASATPSDPSNEMAGKVVRVLIKGIDLLAQGGMITSEGAQSRVKLRASRTESVTIKDVWFGPSTSSQSLNMGFDGTQTETKFSNGGTLTTEINIAAGDFVISEWMPVSISRTNNYLLSYVIDTDTSKDAPMMWKDLNVSTTSIGWTPTTQLATFTGGSTKTATELARQTAAWTSETGIDVSNLDSIPALESIFVSYADEGIYTSRIIDTTLRNPQYNEIDWDANLPAGTDLSFKLRTGDNSDLSDADSWTNTASFSTPRAISSAYKRYIQFQATLKSGSDNLSTPLLKDVTIDWPGETRLVNIGGDFIQGPDHGIFEISVDGRKLESALVIDLEIYKDMRVMKGETRRISSSAKVEINPRNTNF